MINDTLKPLTEKEFIHQSDIQLRSILIQCLNTIDDRLGYPRTIPTKNERQMLEKIRQGKMKVTVT